MPDDADLDALFDSLFDGDYLAFCANDLTDEVSDDEAALIATLCAIGPGTRVLDVPCGHGRIARRLAERGADVVGVDLARAFVELARADAAAAGVAVDYREGDLRALPFRGEFDVAVVWFTSFGIVCDDATLRRALRGLHDALRPGGRLLLETLNLHEPGLTDVSTTTKERHDDDGQHFLIDHSRYDPLDGRLHVRRVVLRAGRPPRELDWTLRLFAWTELRDWLREAGFVDVRAFGADGEVFRVDSGRLIAVARRG